MVGLQVNDREHPEEAAAGMAVMTPLSEAGDDACVMGATLGVVERHDGIQPVDVAVQRPGDLVRLADRGRGGDRQVEQVTVGGGARAGVGESATAGDADAHQDREGYGQCGGESAGTWVALSGEGRVGGRPSGVQQPEGQPVATLVEVEVGDQHGVTVAGGLHHHPPVGTRR